MAIIITPEKDLHLTRGEYNRLLAEYQKAFMFYSGTPPAFEEWAARKKADELKKEPTHDRQ